MCAFEYELVATQKMFEVWDVRRSLYGDQKKISLKKYIHKRKENDNQMVYYFFKKRSTKHKKKAVMEEIWNRKGCKSQRKEQKGRRFFLLAL